MGHETEPTTVYVGLARLPQPPVAPAPTVAVELEVEARTGRIVAASSSLPLPGLERLLSQVLVGKPVEAVEHAVLDELGLRYQAPFAAALRTAVLVAARRAVDGVPCEDGRPSRRIALSSA